ncbi:polysaccharide deacetylase family protein [Paenibacillus faecalis]|uniref:polysaccharide deacetylase family protein n=1 Tax=Paenibacillus faecalis TaxID=2079532 RepID=UPI000D0EF8FB|nr:polysaccharide deacetylase family protein [Paenibacillus faecalis]
MRFGLIVLSILVLCISSACTQNNTQNAQNVTQKNTQNSQKAQPKVKTQQTKTLSNNQTPNLESGKEKDVRNPQPLSLADLHKKYPSTFLLNGPSDTNEVALTFDDAPDDVFTPKILDVLKQEGVKATFFLVGNRIEAHPDVMKRIVQEGHAVGNHSYSHADLIKLNDAEFRDQIQKTDNLIRQYTGYTPNMVRPPYGDVNEEQIKWIASQDKKVINWNVDSLDWKGLSAEEVQTNILSDVRPGSIILQHSGGGEGEDLTGTVEALPKIINAFRKEGLKPVTVLELLDLTKPTK